MKRAALSALACLFLGAGPVSALPDSKLDLGRRDTQLHLGLSFAGTLAGTELLRYGGLSPWKALAGSSLAMALAGIAKEFLHDSRASGGDLMADGLGIAAASGVQVTFRF